MFKAHAIQSIIVSTSIFISQVQTHAAVIAAWDFNGGTPDSLTYTGTLTPSQGAGQARAVGGTGFHFQKGSPDDPSDDNSSWGLNSFPHQETANKTAGAEFRISTVGYRNLRFEAQMDSYPNASWLHRLQYSTNGVDFFDASRVGVNATNGFVSFHHDPMLPGMENNPDAAFRIVTEFERTFYFGAKRGYVASGTNAYSPYGIIRFDLVRLTGDPINPANSPPTLSAIEDLVWPENAPGATVSFTIGDNQSQPDDLRVVVESTDPGLVPSDQLQLSGSGPGRTLAITPLPDRIGTTSIRVTVIDPDGAWVTERFTLRVTSVNLPPALTTIRNMDLPMNTSSGPVGFGTEDEDTPIERLHLSARSTNPHLIESIRFTGDTPVRYIEVIPATNAVGTAVITVTLSDGRDTASKRFAVVVTAPPGVAAYDSFDYGEGDLATASASAWTVHGAGSSPVMTAGGKIHMSGSWNQDVSRPLIGFPYSDGVPIYSGLTVRFSELPSLAGSYFAHLNTSSFRARIFAHQGDAAPGHFRIGIANGAGARSDWPVDLELDRAYRIVTRFNPADGQTALWIDPETEADQPVEAVDSPTPAAITSIALRQSTGIGTLTIDELKCGQSFEAVMVEAPALLSIRGGGGGMMEASWPLGRTPYRLESAVNRWPLIWEEITATPEPRDGHWVVPVSGEVPGRFFRLVTP